VEIDLQSTLASRSKASGDANNQAGGGDNTETDSSFKLAIGPYFSDVIPSVEVESAQTMELEYDWGSERPRDGVESGDSAGTESTVTRATISRIDEGR
jgi:hypothetical protein